MFNYTQFPTVELTMPYAMSETNSTFSPLEHFPTNTLSTKMPLAFVLKVKRISLKFLVTVTD